MNMKDNKEVTSPDGNNQVNPKVITTQNENSASSNLSASGQKRI